MIIKVPLQTYLRTFSLVAAHVIVFSIIAFFFLPQFELKAIIFIGTAFFVYKMIFYSVVSLEMKDHAFIYNGLLKKGKMIQFNAIEEVELEGPSQFNSNYMLAFYSRKESKYENRQELVKFPIYWFSRNDITNFLRAIQSKNFNVQYQKKLGQYIIGENWKNLLVNYLLQYIILAGLLIFIIKKYN